MKYIAYIRKSTDDKTKQVQSMPNQLDWVQKTAVDLGVELLEVFSDKKTAKKPGREGFNAMIEYIYNSREPLGILCWKMSRLSRNPVDAGVISYALIEKKIRHIYASDRQFREDANQILMGVEFGAATQYSIDLKTSVEFGQNRKIESGYRPTFAPLGYLNDGSTVSGNRKIYKDPERFDTLKHAWQKLLTGAYSVEMIRNELNGSGFVSRNGRPLIKSYLYKMFGNTFYAGYYTWKGQTYQGKHPKMITPAEFEKIQEILGRKSTTRPYRNKQLFSGIITCGECGFGITSEHHTKTINSAGKKKKYTYLRCTKKNPLIKCGQKYLSFIKAEKQIEEILYKLKLPKRYLDCFCTYYKQQQQQDVQEIGRKKAALQKKINEHDAMMQNLMDNLNRGVIDDEQYRETMQRYKEKSLKLKQQLQALKSGSSDWFEQFRNDFCFATTALEQYKKGAKNTKREILMRIGSNWTLKDKKLHAELFPPFVLFTKLRVFCDSKNTRLEPSFSRSRSSEKAYSLGGSSLWWYFWDQVRKYYNKGI